MILQVGIPNIKQIEKRLGTLHSKAPDVMQRALNSTIRHTESQIVKQTKKHYLTRAPAIKQTLSVRRAKSSNLSGSVISRANRKIPLIDFKVSPKVPTPKSPPDFYSAHVKRPTSLKNLTGNSNYSKGFIAQMDNGHLGVFQRLLGVQRKGGPRGKGTHQNRKAIDEKIVQLYAVSVPSAIRSPAVSAFLRRDALTFLRDQIDREIKKAIERGLR